jgi:hypothetical protein
MFFAYCVYMFRSYGTYSYIDILLPRTKVRGYNMNRSYGTLLQRALGSAGIVGTDFSPFTFGDIYIKCRRYGGYLQSNL